MLMLHGDDDGDGGAGDEIRSNGCIYHSGHLLCFALLILVLLILAYLHSIYLVMHMP